MWMITNVLLCSFVVAVAPDEVAIMPDRPYLRVELNEPATLECCYSTKVESLDFIWAKRVQGHNSTIGPEKVMYTDRVTKTRSKTGDQVCGLLKFKSVEVNDTAMYQCFLNGSSILSHGTYLQVHEPLEKTINLSEITKNKILTAEGILLLLCVLLPASTLLCQSKKLSDLERKKVRREEENIYQGLNLDDCSAAYDQIERSQAHGPYQDVCNIKEEEEEIQLEKP
ncbi:B-cell antigen receptor complex-associated protein alpha chain isoform X2 [Acanthopagrus latus]|uniref:B-cell antigen receptor complex-associated protein alpha chain isoform X2 n=1 Tax=Acanthopagrus latus TaxID=8177 RepID=UPI00187BC7A4|nr:B-cell antigen receptor complex-associated protein alpha chain isoform X2 [Acanthopagrus latus]